MEELTKHTYSGQNIKLFFFLCLSPFTLLVYESVACYPMGGAAICSCADIYENFIMAYKAEKNRRIGRIREGFSCVITNRL